MPNLAATYSSHPMIRWVKSLDQVYYLPMEVSEMLGVAPSTLHYLGRKNPTEHLGASHQAKYQGVDISLYTADRVEAIRVFLEKQRDGKTTLRGRTRLFTPQEYQDRRRKQRRIRDCIKRAPEYAAAGNHKQEKELLARAKRLQAELAKERKERLRELHAQAGRKSS